MTASGEGPKKEPHAEPPRGGGDGGDPAVLWSLTLADRPGALERVLGVLRRRLVPLEALSLTRVNPGELALELRLEISPEQKERIRAELGGLVDVRPPGPCFANAGVEDEPRSPSGPPAA